MKFHICAVLLCLVQDGQALRDANENGKSSLPDVNETKEASCGTQCSIKKKTQLPSDVQHEVDEENNYAHQPRKRDIPNWSEKYDKDPHGHLHMGSALGMFMIALLLQWTTQPQQRKDAVASAMRKARKPRFLNQAAARADVDAEGSDSEDEATSSSDSHGTPCVMNLGPGMRFLDEDLEEEWEKESYPKNQQRGAVLLALVAFGLAVDRFYAFYELQSCKGDQWWMQKSLQIGCILVMVKVFAFLLMVPAVEGAKNGEAASFFLPSKFWDSTYWIILGFFGCFFIVVNLWPISPSCDILSVMARVCSYKSVWIANEKLDCTLQGHTACQMIQLWMLIMPYALPQFRCFHLTFLWLGFFYVGVSWLYAEISGEKTHMVDLGLHFSMLVVTAILGTMKKYYLEKGMRRQFLEDNLQRKALEHLYVVFDGMVPKYVIPRMLMQKPICDYRPRVSILFVLIHDFHVSDANAALTFLNTYFGKMDDICAAHKVTKIETVAEEYVCSVGVVPEDLPGDTSAITAERQHQELLERLFGAAYEIQQLQNEAQKKFKMGIHTGEIHAGVIGQKLPRFRLFGDTINTSARMMQKASPGQLLFGEATNRLLPSSLKVKEADGIIVKMKGKGDVKAFYYDETNFPKSSVPAKEPSPDKPKEMVVKAEVNKAIRLSDGERPQSLPFLLSEKVDFKSHDPVKEPKFSEEKFQMWFHLGFARKFRLRLHRQILLMAFMTVMDVMHMEHTEAWKVEDKDPGLLPKHPTKRFVILLSCRAVILAMGLGWSVFARTEAFRERVQEVQWGLVASTLIVATVMFVSYDALIYPQLHRSYVTMHFLDYVNQQQSLIFVLAYFIVTNTHPTLFYQSLVYIPLGVVFMYIRNRTSLYISDIGRVMFLCTVVISCLLAHVLEQTSRARFKTKQRVEETQDRVETVLSNLMPKKVLEEIKLSPGLQRSHSYDHATIAQSDLCGFTQLASDKSPEQVVAFVEDLFGRFDRLTDEFQIYKVETVGDAYIAGMAEHTLTSENSPIQVVQFGMAMIQATAEWAEKLGVKVTCRVGVHHGHCVGGVVGKGMQRYHLFGSFMSELDTLEATSREGITQISRACKDAIVREHLQRLGDAAREATLTDVAALEKLQKEFDGAIERSDDKLTTSKGEEHDYSEVGGRTFLIYKLERGVVFVDQNGTPRGSAGTKTMGGGGSKVLDAHRKNLCKQAISGSETWKDKETKMLETFKAWDTDNSGSITKDELQEVFTRLGCKVSSSELQKVLKDADADKDSKISYEEFVAWLCRAPHLEHYFKLSEDILKRNMKDAMAMQQKMQKEIEKSDNPLAAMMKIGVKLEAVQKKGQERIDKELKPVIQKTFQYHDKDGNGVLSYDESIIFFSNYAERLGPFAKSMAELATTQAMNACEIKVDMSSIQKEFDKEFDKCLTGYTSDIDKRHKAAWDALDVNKDGKLQEAEIIEALLHGHPKNQQFMKALGLLVEDKSMTAAGPSAKVEMPMEDCQVQ